MSVFDLLVSLLTLFGNFIASPSVPFIVLISCQNVDFTGRLRVKDKEIIMAENEDFYLKKKSRPK